ncbi:MAG: tRNA pseudouridine(55) synthase TruB, partial [Burkholderiales bacterium]
MTQIISTTKRTRRPIDGVLLLDKPVGPSSSRVLGHVKHLLKAAKAGHGGTLDPMASGLLPLMFGESTKYAAEGLDADKTYIAEIALGEKTSTGDREGETILRMPVPSDLSEEKLHAVLRAFRGPQTQIPPMFSALKKDGRALYDYARAGEEVDRPARKITIHAIKLLGWTLPNLIVRVV